MQEERTQRQRRHRMGYMQKQRKNEGDLVGKPLIVVSSVTYAMKGRDLLFRHGIRGYVERIPRTEETGCGYGIYVPEGADMAERILLENRIRVLRRMEQEGDRP